MLLVDVNNLHYFQDDLFNRIDDYAACEDTIVIFFNSIGMLMDGIDGGNYWNRSVVICFDILAAPPFFYHAAIESDIENVTLLQDIKRQQNRILGIIGQNGFFHFR